MTNRTLTVAARLAAATALTGSLAACDGRFGRAASELFSPVSSTTPAAQSEQEVYIQPAVPGNPVYIDGSQASNNAAYQQTYGAPLEGSGQSVYTAPQVQYAPSVYDDSTINQAPLGGTAAGNVYEYGKLGIDVAEPRPQSVPAYGIETPVPVETGVYSAPVETYDTGFGAGGFPQPVETYPSSTPVDGTIIYSPQSSIPVSNLGELFSDASYAPNAGTGVEGDLQMSVTAPAATGVQMAYVIEDRRDTVVDTHDQPYGSTASHRYSVEEEPLPSVQMPYGAAFEEVAPKPAEQDEAVRVAFLTADSPLPRTRPDAMGTTFHKAALRTPIPVKRPEIAESVLRSPVPQARPAGRIPQSGRAIAEAPPLTEPPKMIQVEAVFDDEIVPEDVKGTEVAAMASALKIIDEADFPAEPESSAEPETKVKDKPPVKEKPEVTEVAVKTDDVEAAEEGEPRELSGTSWRLVRLGASEVDAVAELHFDGGSGFAGGQSFCNNYGGEFSEKLDGSFSMANIFTTETKCPHSSLEKKYIVALEGAEKYRIAPGLKELSLMGPDGEEVATFTAF